MCRFNANNLPFYKMEMICRCGYQQELLKLTLHGYCETAVCLLNAFVPRVYMCMHTCTTKRAQKAKLI